MDGETQFFSVKDAVANLVYYCGKYGNKVGVAKTSLNGSEFLFVNNKNKIVKFVTGNSGSVMSSDDLGSVKDYLEELIGRNENTEVVLRFMVLISCVTVVFLVKNMMVAHEILFNVMVLNIY